MFKKMFAAILLLCMGNVLGVADSSYEMIVAQDGSGDFLTVQDAINAVPDYRKAGATRIHIKKGIYKEKVIIPPSKENVQLIGGDSVVITYDDYAAKPNIFGEGMGTSGSATIYVFAPGFVAEDIVFENSSGPVGQAVACHVAADRVAFRRCCFLGFQDTLYTFGEYTREYYEDCYIEGTVDFIFGKATAVFNRCEVHSKKSGGFLTAPATPQDCQYGYVFYDCSLTANSDVEVGSVCLSRPWRPYGKAVFIRCNMGCHISPQGFHNWGKPENEETAYFAEFLSSGDGSNAEKRVPWAHQLSDIRNYCIQDVLSGDDGWNPLIAEKP